MLGSKCHLTARGSLRKRVRALSIGVCSILLGVTAAPTRAELPSCTENALIVFDASGSMGILEGRERRIDAARRAIADVLPSIAASRPTGLVTYSGGSASTCSDIALRVPPMQGNAARILSEIDKLDPGGPTPLTRAVSVAAAELKRIGEAGIVVLVTDGSESCMQSACSLAQAIAADASGIRIFTIGFRLTATVAAANDLVCLAEATGGTHATADTVEELRAELRAALACPRLASGAPW
jgi:Ca-activated chloride channel family protein